MCFFCKEDNYNLLDSHRIISGEENGKYIWDNVVTVCSNCHRKIHSGEINIEKKYRCTNGGFVIKYMINGFEYWEFE